MNNTANNVPTIVQVGTPPYRHLDDCEFAATYEG